MGWMRRGIRRVRGAVSRSGTVKVEAKLVDPITWDVYDRACYSIGLDPDVVRENPEKALEEMDDPSMKQMEEFLQAVLLNHQAFDIRRDFEIAGARQFVQGVLAFFLKESHVSSRSRNNSLSAFLELYGSLYRTRKVV